MFASTGIEAEIVAAADLLDVAPPSRLPVATTGHLIAMKLLSRADDRPLDDADSLSLGAIATAADWRSAEAALDLIVERGYHRGRDLAAALAALRQRLERIAQSPKEFVEPPTGITKRPRSSEASPPVPGPPAGRDSTSG